MSYQEKRNIVSIITGIAILTAYCIYAFGQVRAGSVAPDDFKFWARTILIFIGIGVGASIVIQIIFHILLSIAISIKKSIQEGNCDEKEIERSIEVEVTEDEMDKLIQLKAMRFAFAIAGIGFIAALVSLLLNYSFGVMINILFISFSVGSIIEGLVQMRFYRKGIGNA